MLSVILNRTEQLSESSISVGFFTYNGIHISDKCFQIFPLGICYQANFSGEQRAILPGYGLLQGLWHSLEQLPFHHIECPGPPGKSKCSFSTCLIPTDALICWNNLAPGVLIYFFETVYKILFCKNYAFKQTLMGYNCFIIIVYLMFNCD